MNELSANIARLSLTVLLSLSSLFVTAQKNSIGLDMVEIAPGSFLMGDRGGLLDYDEAPAHIVTITNSFRISSKEVTNEQYEVFDPQHRLYRGKGGFSSRDDEAVVFVSYDDALLFCEWLSKREGKHYRLPTEAEWEYACRAGTMGPYPVGDRSFPKKYHKNQELSWDPIPVSLKTGTGEPNPWGLYDMNGNVEEWCLDCYGPYPSEPQVNPAGYVSGYAVVCRGGSHGTPVKYLRSANRSANLRQSRNVYTGFRVVESSADDFTYLSDCAKPVKRPHRNLAWKKTETPYFARPENYITRPGDFSVKGMFSHNHCPAATWLPNGDILVIWFSCMDEKDREMNIMQSRLKAGSRKWTDPEIFFTVADRNLTGSALYYDEGAGILYHFNGLSASGCWKNMACIVRTSTDCGYSWSEPVFVDSEYRPGNQVIDGVIRTSDGTMLLPCDATHSVRGGTLIHFSNDGGREWQRYDSTDTLPKFREGKSGSRIAGIHARIVELADGSLMALGRDDNIVKDGVSYMPKSISKDRGRTWEYSASPFPPISSGQRLVLMRLNEGPLLLISFTDAVIDRMKGLDFNYDGQHFIGYGLYAALSYDEGRTWPVRKLLTDGSGRYMYGGAFTGYFRMDQCHSEPKGYMTAFQSPDNRIHVFSSAVHYSFNLSWLTE